MKFHGLFVLLIVHFCVSEAYIWNWFWSTAEESRDLPKIDQLTLLKVPYEAKTEDEKFLEEAKKFTDLKLSDLDSCQHKVILKIKTSCSDLTEEELGKLAVNLLNCQSAIEGRQQFSCTDGMALRQCTSSMDSDMWNTYHLMSNRARAVCYHTRQQQFRVLSQMTVNMLMNSAQDQIMAMNTLKEGQEKLEVMTTGAMDTVAAGQEALLKQQERMKLTHQNLRDFVSINLQQLVREKALIASGHHQLSKLIEDISAKLDGTSSQLVVQSSEQQQNHKEILRDLKIIQEQAHNIWNEIEHSTMKMITQQQAAAAQYEDTLHKLIKINDTVTFLLELMESTKQELDERLGWLSAVVGAAGVYMVVLHALYLLIGMVATAFLQASTFTKLVLVFIVPMNLTAIYHSGQEASLGFVAMTAVIVFFATVHWVIIQIRNYLAARKKTVLQPQSPILANGFTPITVVTRQPPSSPVSISWRSRLNLLRKSVEEAWIMCITWFKSWLFGRPSIPSKNVPVTQKVQSKHSDYEDNSSDTDDEFYKNEFLATPPPSVVDTISPSLKQRFYHGLPTPSRTPSLSGSPMSSRSGTPRPMCQATCRTGLLCRNPANPGSDVCRIHSSNSSFQ